MMEVSDQQIMIHPQKAVDILVYYEGNVHLAAEKSGVPRHVLAAAIARDPSAQRLLRDQLRALAMLDAFDTLRATKAMIDEALTEMEPGELVKFYGDMLKSVANMTDSRESTVNMNVTELMLGSLPPRIRGAVEQLMVARARPLDAVESAGEEAA